MIVVVGRVITDAAKRDELIGLAQAVASASREEEGCISYRFYQDTERADEFVFVEEWADQQAVQRHFGTDHIRVFMAGVGGTVVAAPEVMFHTIASSMSLAEVSAAR